MKQVRIQLTDEQYDALAQLAYDATIAYGKDIPLAAVIMCAAMKGMGAVRYEMNNNTPRLRLVHNDRAGNTRQHLEKIPQGNPSERQEG